MEVEDDVEAAVGPVTTPRTGARAAARSIRRAGAWATVPDPARGPVIGVVLGTGLGAVAETVADQVAIAAADTGWLCRSTATGHAGRIVCGTLAGIPIAILQGRVHGYEGFPPEALGRGVELLAALGATTLLLTNASGGLRPDMHRRGGHRERSSRPRAKALG